MGSYDHEALSATDDRHVQQIALVHCEGVDWLCRADPFCFFSLLSIAGANLGLLLMLVALLLSPEAWKQLSRQSLFWIAFLTIAYVLLSRYILTVDVVGDLDIRNDQTRDWALIFLFPVTAWWLSRHPNRIVYAFGLMFAGFASGMLYSLWDLDLAYLLGGGAQGCTLASL